MVNIYKYSETLEPNTIKIGNFLIASREVGYGDTPRTNYWNGIDIPDEHLLMIKHHIGSPTFSYTVGSPVILFRVYKNSANFEYDFPLSGINPSMDVEYIKKSLTNWTQTQDHYVLLDRIYQPVPDDFAPFEASLNINSNHTIADIVVVGAPIGVTYNYDISGITGSGVSTGSFTISSIDISSLSNNIYLDFDVYSDDSTSDILIEPTLQVGGDVGFTYEEGYIYGVNKNSVNKQIRIDFTRDSVGYTIDRGYRLIETPPGIPRIQWEGVPYLLLEPTSTNLINENINMDTAASFGGSFDVVKTKYLTDPFGGNKAHSITTNTDIGQDSNNRVSLNGPVTVGQVYTLTLYHRSNDSFDFYVDIADKVVASDISVNSNWTKLTGSSIPKTANNFSDITFDPSGDGEVTLELFGHQVEESTFPTSTILTEGSSRTRLQDEFLNNITPEVGSNKGMIFFDFLDTELFGGINTNLTVFQLLDGSSSIRIIGQEGAGYVDFPSLASGSINISDVPNKLLFKWVNNIISVFESGSLLGTVSQTTTFNPDTITNSTPKRPMKLREFRIYNDVISDQNCINMTT